MEAKLVVVNGKAGSEEFQLDLPTIIGRSKSANVPIGHPLVSRQHCELFEADGVLMVRDMGSLNGTYIDDMRLAEEAMALRPGRRLTVGPTTFKAVYEAPLGEAEEEVDFSESDAGADTAVIEQTHRESAPAKSSRAADDEEQHDEADLSPPSGSRDQGFDLGWLSDPEEAAEEPAASAHSEAVTEDAPAAAHDEAEEEEEEEEEKPEPKPAKARFFFGKGKAGKTEPEKAKPEKAAPAKGKPAKAAEESADTVMFEPSHSDTHDFSPAEKSGAHGDEPEEGENLDDFFDTLK